MTTPNTPDGSFHLDSQANLARLAHIDVVLDDLVRRQADGEALIAKVVAAGAKATRSELNATCQRLCSGALEDVAELRSSEVRLESPPNERAASPPMSACPDDFAPLPVQSCSAPRDVRLDAQLPRPVVASIPSVLLEQPSAPAADLE